MHEAGGAMLRIAVVLFCALLAIASCSNKDGNEPYAFLINRNERGVYSVNTSDFASKTCLVAEGIRPRDEDVVKNMDGATEINRLHYIDESSGYWNLVLKNHRSVVNIISVPQSHIRWMPYGDDPGGVDLYKYQRYICKSNIKVYPRSDSCRDGAPCFEIK